DALHEWGQTPIQIIDDRGLTQLESDPIHAALSESTISSRAARTLGRNPPTKPITREKASVVATMRGVRWNPNASCENDCQFMVVMVKACRPAASASPTTPPVSASRI